MKTNFLKVVMALLGVGCILATSCLKTQETLKPVFPENKIQKTVVAGESVDIVFEANLDWELSLSGEGVMSYFWIDDAGTKESKIKGSAGSQTVTVQFSDENELDTNRKCIVTLTMGGQSCEIAEIDRLMIARTVIVKVAKHFETAFQKVDGNYVYDDIEEGSSLKFISFPEEAEYALPIKVQSNFDWDLAFPDWIETSCAKGNAGDTEVYLSAVLSEKIMKGQTGSLSFIDDSNQDAKIEVEISIDSFADRVEFTGKSFESNADGQIKSLLGEYVESGYFTVLAAKGAVVKVLGFDGQSHDTDFASWVTVEETGTPGDALLSKRTFSIKANPTAGAARVADILVLPASMAELTAGDLCVSDDGCPFKEAVQPYVFGSISQLASEAGPVEGQGVLSIDPEYDTCDAKLTFLEDSWLKYEFDTDQFYELLYTGEFSDTQILSSTPIANAQVLNFNLEPVGEDMAFWATTWVSPEDARIFKVNADLDIYERVGAADEELVPECFVALCDAEGNIIAVIDFKYDLGGSISEGDTVSLEGEYGTIEKLTSGDMYYFIASEYGVEDVYNINVNVSKAVIKLAKAPDDFKIYSFDMNSGAAELDDRLHLEGGMNNTFTCYIDQSVTETATWLIVFKSNWANYLAILFTYNPESAGPYVSFAYPDDVQNATLEMYTGDLLETILSEQYGLTADAVYFLKYTGEPQMAQLNVPGEPYIGAAWNNFESSADYWLTYEMEGDLMYVLMTGTGKEDYFLWKDSNGLPLFALVCTAEIN